MKNHTIPLRTLLAAACLLSPLAASAQVPQMLNYQGRVASGDPPVNFDGSGQFKFALVDGGSNTASQATGTAILSGEFVTDAFVTNGGSGYTFTNAGAGKGATHPVQTVNWWDCVKWCNARSQQAGRTPVYYTDAGLTTVYKTGQPTTVYVDWVVSGYRLPTEAEWEKAARGGRSNQRFPWGNTISHSQANYYGATGFAYDLSPINNYHPTYATGGFPYTSPVGSFAANGYGLNDMAGNVFQWCWDWYGTPYAGGSDPYGPASGSNRVLRGGGWGNGGASLARCAGRNFNSPDVAVNGIGFRAVLAPGQ